MKHPLNKLRTNRLSTKIIVMVEVVLILSNSLFCVVSIINSRFGIRKSIQQRMLDIANCAAGSISGDSLQGITAADEGTEAYREIYKTLSVFRDNVELEYVYAIKDEGDDRFTFILDTDPVAPGAYGAEVKYTAALAAAAAGKASVDETPYTDAWGRFYSAYSPVYNSSGKVAGIVAADFSVAWFDNQLSEQTLSTVTSYCVILLVTLLAAALLSLVAVTPFVLMQKQLSDEVKEKADENEQLFLQIVRSLADAKDPYTNGHSRRVSQYSVMLAEAAGWNAERVNTLRYAALLHDIGKIGVPDSILNNPKRLTDVEYDIIRTHSAIGGDILKNGIRDAIVENVARYHHERYDGAGYPTGLRGQAIPEEARIVAIADAFDAMSSNRVYRQACDHAHIRQELEAGRGSQFDPELTDRFVDLWERGLLDSVIESEPDEADEGADSPTALLREVVDAFVSQSTVVDRALYEAAGYGPAESALCALNPEAAEGDATDVNSIARVMEKSGTYSGALEVEYRQFARLYEFISNLEKRFSNPFKLILISLDPAPGEAHNPQALERETGFMERSIRQSVRNVDILTRYKKNQFLIILLGTDFKGALIAVDRIFRDYFKMNGNSVYMPSYFIAEMDGTAPKQ